MDELAPSASLEDGLLPGAGPSVTVSKRRYLHESSPWRAKDAGRSTALVVAGLLGTLTCWYGASGEVGLRDQVPWILGGMGSSALSALGFVVWLTAGFGEVRRGQRELMLDMRTVWDLPIQAPSREQLPAEELPEARTQGSRVTATGMTRAHRPDCLLAKGKAVEIVSNSQARAGQLGSCGVCQS